MSVKQRLKDFIEFEQMSDRQFCLSIGVSAGYVNSISKSIQPDKINSISARYPNLNTEWLLTGNGGMIRSATDNLVQYATLTTKRERGNIRYWLDIDATGSGVVSFEDSDTNRFIDISIPEFKDCTDAINLYGDSMAPRYKSGQIVILKKWQESFIEYGNPYLIITQNGHRMVKVLRSIKDDLTSVLCVSFNPDFDPFPIEKEDILELYIVKGAIEKSVL